MSDDKTNRGPQDRGRIAINEDYQVRYWTEKFGVSAEDLARAVEAACNPAEAVEQYLRGR